MFDLALRRARLAGREDLLDVAIAGGVIQATAPPAGWQAAETIDLAGRLLIPGFVESHLHLDIALVNAWQRPGRAEPYRSQLSMTSDAERARRSFTHRSIVERAGQALDLACRHGVTALRAQCHVDTEIGLKHLEALLEVKQKYAGRVTLQLVAFPQHGLLTDPQAPDLMRAALRLGADAMGCSSGRDHDSAGRPLDVRGHIDLAFALAMEQGVDLDMHADLGLPPLGEDVRLEDLEIVYAARRTIELGYQGRVNAGHASKLGVAPPSVAAQAIDVIARAGISVISLPDLYRLGRSDPHSVRRGLTRVKELLAAGVNVAYASNNVRDPLRPLGNFDLLEEGLILAYGAHMDSVEELDTILNMSTFNAARALKLPAYGLQPGCAADLVVLDAPSPSAALVGQAEKAYVFKQGRLVAANRRESTLYPL